MSIISMHIQRNTIYIYIYIYIYIGCTNERCHATSLIEAGKCSERNEIINATIQRVNGELMIRNSNWMMERIIRETKKTKSNTSTGVIMEVGFVISYIVLFDIWFKYMYIYIYIYIYIYVYIQMSTSL